MLLALWDFGADVPFGQVNLIYFYEDILGINLCLFLFGILIGACLLWLLFLHIFTLFICFGLCGASTARNQRLYVWSLSVGDGTCRNVMVSFFCYRLHIAGVFIARIPLNIRSWSFGIFVTAEAYSRIFGAVQMMFHWASWGVNADDFGGWVDMWDIRESYFDLLLPLSELEICSAED